VMFFVHTPDNDQHCSLERGRHKFLKHSELPEASGLLPEEEVRFEFFLSRPLVPETFD
jgi:hypothetical protein